MRHNTICFSLLALLGCSGSSPTSDAAVSQDVAVVTDRIAPTDAPTTTTDAPMTTTDTGGDGGSANACEGLGELCHEVDPGSGPIHDCHEGAHDSNAMWCATNGARCRMVCLAEGTRLCTGLGSLCHGVDPGSGPLHDCHDGAHDGDPTWCARNANRCRALCTAAADGGAPSDGGHTAGDGGHSATDAGHSATDAGHQH